MGTIAEFNVPQEEALNTEKSIRRSGLGLLSVSILGAIFGGYALYDTLILPPKGVIKHLIDTNRAGVEVYQLMVVRIIWAYTLFVASCFVLSGSFQMLKRRNFRRVRASCVVAMVPLVGPCFVLGIPFGIWAFLVLSKPGARQLFNNVPAQPKKQFV